MNNRDVQVGVLLVVLAGLVAGLYWEFAVDELDDPIGSGFSADRLARGLVFCAVIEEAGQPYGWVYEAAWGRVDDIRAFIRDASRRDVETTDPADGRSATAWLVYLAATGELGAQVDTGFAGRNVPDELAAIYPSLRDGAPAERTRVGQAETASDEAARGKAWVEVLTRLRTGEVSPTDQSVEPAISWLRRITAVRLVPWLLLLPALLWVAFASEQGPSESRRSSPGKHLRSFGEVALASSVLLAADALVVFPVVSRHLGVWVALDLLCRVLIASYAARRYFEPGQLRLQRSTVVWSASLLVLCVALVDAVRILSDKIDSRIIVVDQAWIPGAFELAFSAGSIILTPVTEELLFRGFLLTALRARFGAKTAILLSSAAFALYHVGQPTSRMPALFLVGLAMAVVRVRSGSIVPCILAHAGINAWAVYGAAVLSVVGP